MWDICCCSLCKVLSNSIVPHNTEGGAQTKISYFPTLKKMFSMRRQKFRHWIFLLTKLFAVHFHGSLSKSSLLSPGLVQIVIVCL